MRARYILRLRLIISSAIALAIMLSVVIVGATKAEPPIQPVHSNQDDYQMVSISMPIAFEEPPESAGNTVIEIEPEESPLEQQIDSTPLYEAEELEAVARVLSGECYDDEIEDKQNVVWVICNRVSDGRFGDGIVDVITKPDQFMGYWAQGREISESDYAVAEQVLNDYFDGMEPPHDYLYFTGGTGKTNNFSHTW